MSWPTVVAAALALLGFAANSLLCRLALRDGAIDPATFSLVRIVSGAAALALLSRGRLGGSWAGAGALWLYAVGFSFAYLSLGAGSGALLLFGAVQLTLLGAGLAGGERLAPRVAGGWIAAAAGVAVLLAPGLTAPEPTAAAAMVLAGVAWGVYTVLGRSAPDALAATAGNFVRASPLVALSWLPFLRDAHADLDGLGLALVSGVLTSGVGYSLWYAALPSLGTLRAAVLQLLVPILVAAAGVALLGEPPTWRLALASALVVGGAGAAVALRRK